MARQINQGSNWIRRSTRLAIYARDGHRCVYCQCKVRPGRGTKGVWAAHLDHLHPQELGGRSTADNLVTACRTCNDKKGTMNVSQFARSLPAGVANRVRTALATPIDRAEGRRLAKLGK